MQKELDFTKPEVPNSGRNCPETSYDAAHKFKESAKCLRARVFRFIKNCEEFGATSSEIHEYFGIDKNSTSPRITELKDEGRIIKHEKRRKNKKGNKEVVWTVA